MNTVYFNSHVNDQRRRQLLFDGQLFVFSRTKSSAALCDFAREMIEEAFGPLDPRTAQYSLPVDEFVKIAGPLKPRFIHHPTSKKLLVEILAEFGCDLEETYFDVPKLRVVTHGGYLTSGVGYALHPHRDTWYSSSFSQVHWWLPIYDIESESSLAFHPRYWNQPVRNDSSGFNYYDWNRERKTAATLVKEDKRFQPHSEDPIELDPQLRFVCETGGVVMFSAAHLHSTVPNTSGLTRFSIDFRTVHVGDLASRCGAPNIDSSPSGTNLRDFMRCTDYSSLPAQVIGQYENPDAIQGREDDLVFRPAEPQQLIA